MFRGSKRGVSEELVNLLRWFFLIWVVIHLLIVMFVTSSKTIDSDRVELAVISNRILYHSINQENEFTRQSLDSKINYSIDRRLGGKLTVESEDVYLNEKWYKRLIPRAGYDVVKYTRDLWLRKNGQTVVVHTEAVQ